MAAPSLWIGTVCFGLGIVLQAIVMLRGSFQPGDWKRAGKSALFGLIGLAPVRREHPYDVRFHLSIVFTVLGFAFAYFFRDRLLTRIGGRLLLAWNILLIHVALSAGWNSTGKLLLLGLPTIPTIVNAFSDIDRKFGWKVFFYAWFSTILVVVAIAGIDTGPVGVFFGGDATVPGPLSMIVGGAAFLYIVANAWFVLALAPFPIQSRQQWNQRREQIRRHVKLLAHGYVWEKDDPWRSLAVLLGLPLLLFAVARWGSDDQAIVALAIALMPLLGGRPPEKSEPDPLATRAGSR